MPVYLHVFNLIIDKRAVEQKYPGGIEKFRIDYGIPESEIDQEDDELFSFGQMNYDQLHIDSLISNGLNYDPDRKESNDFTIVYRYGGLGCDVNWLKHNRVFAWHISTSSHLIMEMEEICNMTVDDITKEMEKGNNLLKTIRNERI